jgi:hypothetical protein
MISSAEFKKALGPAAHDMSEIEIERLRTLYDRLADIFFDIFAEKNKQNQLN